jgi:hypothetical protein
VVAGARDGVVAGVVSSGTLDGVERDAGGAVVAVVPADVRGAAVVPGTTALGGAVVLGRGAGTLLDGGVPAVVAGAVVAGAGETSSIGTR